MQTFTKLIYIFICLIATPLYSQDTFSIVAVDSVTGEIGSAGASCLDDSDIAGGVVIISDIIKGRGAIHTQAAYNPGNKNSARNRMLGGLSPSEIITWLINNDISGTPDIRQYGIVDFDSAGNPRAAAYTGVNCMDYKNHIVGPNYAIQGNILLGQEILDSMENRFLNTTGSLADKLMAAMQGANVPGADTRCLSEGVSSLSAFLKVARPWDPEGFSYIDLRVTQTPFGVEPIDSLQLLFDTWSPPNCMGVIPNDAVVADTNQVKNDNNKSFWVCGGDTLTLSGSNNTVFLESGAALVGDLGNNNRIYIKDSASIDAFLLTQSEVYFGEKSNLINPGLGPIYFACDSITFDYTMAPANGCFDNTNRLEEKDFSELGWDVYPNPAQNYVQIDLQTPVKKSGTITLYDFQGREVLKQNIQTSTRDVKVELRDKMTGVYLLEIRIDNQVGIKKWMIE